MRRAAVIALVIVSCHPRVPPGDLDIGTDEDEVGLGDPPSPDHFGTFRLPSGEMLYAAYAEVGDIAIVDGDMGFPLSSLVSSGPRAYAAGVATREQLWPGGVIPYMFDDTDDTVLCPERTGPIRDSSAIPLSRRTLDQDLEERLRQRVLAAMKMWEPAGIRFRPLTAEERESVLHTTDAQGMDHLVFCRWSKGFGNSSGVGRFGHRQRIHSRFGSGTGGIAHEMGHAIGLFHEQQRSDRDQFVRFDAACVDPADPLKIGNFNTYVGVTAGRDLGPYDYGSIMHYRRSAFSKGCDTLTPIRDGVEIDVVIGQRKRPSEGDLEGVRTMYRGLAMQTAFREAPVVFGEAGFRGDFQVLQASRYEARGLRVGWIEPRFEGAAFTYTRTQPWIESVRVPPGVIVTLCADASAAECITTSESLTTLGALANRVTFATVERAVTLFTEPSFAGLRRTYRPGLYAGSTIQDGRVASAVVPPGLHLSLCQGERRDVCLDLPSDHADPGTAGALVTQVQVRAAATLFLPPDRVEPGKSAAVTLLPGTYSLASLGSSWADGQIGQIVVAHGLVLRLCRDDTPSDAACDDWEGDAPDVPGDGLRVAIVLRRDSCEATWSCGQPAVCGNHHCELGERVSCPQDCGITPPDEEDEGICRVKPWMCDPLRDP